MHWALFTMEPAVAGGVVVGDRWLADCVTVDPMLSSALLCGTSPALCSTGQLFRTKVIIASIFSVPSDASFRNNELNQQSARYCRCG
jgi:hypothetical protein